jgi:Tfp pilus assembly protein PilN
MTTPVLRVPPVAANLLPLEIIQSRRVRRVGRLVLTGLGVFAVLLVGWYGLASFQTAQARDALVGAEARAQSVRHDQRRYADLMHAQAESAVISSQLGAVLDKDLPWSTLLPALRAAVPAGVDLAGVTGGLTTSIVPGKKAATTGPKPIGTLTLTGTARDGSGVAAYLDALAKVPGVAGPVLDSTTMADGVLRFSLRLTVTDAVLGGRYTPKGGR